MQSFLKRTILLLLLATIAGCIAAPDRSSNIRNDDLHALMSGRIEVLLAQMETLVLEQQRTELEVDAERRRRSGRVAESARVLQDAALQLLALQPQLGLREEQVPVFTALAGRLQEHGSELEQLALRNEFQALQDAMAGTRATCDSCHNLFRAN